MKKLIAVLSVCMMITCSFASCGDETSDESSEKSVSVSESQAETSEPETEEDTTEEETTTTETETVTEEETTETTSEAEISVSDVVGMWYAEDDGTTMIFNVKEDGNIDFVVDVTEVTHFTADGSVFIGDEVFEPECIDYDGKNLVIAVNDMEAFNMTKDSGDADSYDGEYTLNSGVMYDSVAEDGRYDVGIIVNGEMMFAGYRNVISYSTDGNVVSLSGLENLDYDFDTAELEYKVSGDTLTLFGADDDGGDMIFEKFDFENYTPVSVSTENNETSSEEEVTEIPAEDITIDGNIVGTWISDDLYGFRFEENGSGSVFLYATDIVHFTADGQFFMSEMTLESETISFDGTNLSITVMENDVLTMTRNDGNNPDTFDGTYIFKSGAFYEGMVTSLAESFGINSEDAIVYAIVDGEEMYIEFAGLFTYTAEDGTAVFNGLEGIGVPDGSDVEYEFSGDNLIIEEGIFTRIDI